MIKLKPIAESILLQEAAETVTWGDVKQAFDILKSAHSKEEAVAALKKAGTLGASFIPGAEFLVKSLEMVGQVKDSKELLKSLLTIGKNVSNAELKNPKDTKWKQLTGPFWDAIKLSPEVSTMLDDKIEQEFINKVIVPELSKPESDTQPIPNMDELLGKWLNKRGLKDKADIHFVGKAGNI